MSVGSERFNKTTYSESSHGVQPSTLSVEGYFHILLDIFKRRCEIPTSFIPMMSNSEKSSGSTHGELSRSAQPSLASVGSERFNKTAYSESSHGIQPPTLSVEEA